MAQYFSKEKYCGHTDWISKKPNVITGMVCSGEQMADNGDTDLQIIQLEEKYLYLGDTSTVKGGERPSKLNLTKKYERESTTSISSKKSSLAHISLPINFI